MFHVAIRSRSISLPWLHLALSALSSLLITLLFFTAAWGSLGRGGGERVTEAFASGALKDSLKGDQVTGRHQYNDCLILALALKQDADPLLLAVSPINPFGSSERVCEDLRAGFVADKPTFYHNYLHGHTVLVRYLLPHLPVQTIREIYKGAGSTLLLAGLAICMLRLREDQRRRENLAFLITLLGLSRFFGLEMFGQSLGHGPSDLLIIGFVLVLSLRAGRIGRAEWVYLTGLFGALTMIFEFLTGGLPLGLAMIVGLGWFALQHSARSIGNVVAGPLAYSVGAGVALALKLLFLAGLFGPEALVGIADAGLQRMHGDDARFNAVFAFQQLLIYLDVLTPGLPIFAAGFLFLSMALGAGSLTRANDAPMLLLLLSWAPIFLWFLIFAQHTSIHAWFMARILVWPLISGFIMVANSSERPTVPDATGKWGLNIVNASRRERSSADEQQALRL